MSFRSSLAGWLSPLAACAKASVVQGSTVGLLVFSACGGDSPNTPAPTPCVDACELGAVECTDANSRRKCEKDADGCSAWVAESACDASSTCEDGQCVGCPDGCCGSCPTYECGAGSDDGCGRSCGGASGALEAAGPVAAAICSLTMPCCGRGELLCTYDTSAECEATYESNLVGSALEWCDAWVERCLDELGTATCATLGNGLPEACNVLADNPFVVVPDPDAPDTCSPTDTRRCGVYGCGSDGICLDRCESNDDCVNGTVCREESCVSNDCEQHGDCVAYLCVNGECATECSTSAQCQDSHYCDANGECVIDQCQSATESADCNGYVCWDNQCRTTCTNNGECADTHECIELEGVCLGKCGEFGPSVCNGYLCGDDGLCRTQCDPSVFKDCYLGSYCVDGECVPTSP